MGFIIDSIVAIPIGIIYNMMIHEFADLLNEKSNYNEKIQRSLLVVFGGGIMGFCVGYFLTKNLALKFGMFLGAILLISHVVMYNWETMRNDTRIIVMVLSLAVLIWYSYVNSDEINDNQSDEIEDMENTENDDEKENIEYNNVLIKL